jgi:hypothetical protein
MLIYSQNFFFVDDWRLFFKLKIELSSCIELQVQYRRGNVLYSYKNNLLLRFCTDSRGCLLGVRNGSVSVVLTIVFDCLIDCLFVYLWLDVFGHRCLTLTCLLHLQYINNVLGRIAQSV